MATQTIALARFAQELVRYEVDYDDVTLLVTALRCINNSDQGPTAAPSSGRVWLINDTTRDFPQGSFSDPTKARVTAAGVTETAPVSQTQARRMQLIVVDRHGNPAVGNLGGEFTWPAG
jgi:hypothetical protein